MYIPLFFTKAAVECSLRFNSHSFKTIVPIPYSFIVCSIYMFAASKRACLFFIKAFCSMCSQSLMAPWLCE